jgi:hypothetical protein
MQVELPESGDSSRDSSKTEGGDNLEATHPVDLAPGLEVRPDPGSGGLGVFAKTAFKAGDRLGYFIGHATSVRSQMSLQFGAGLFIEPGPKDPLRNLNHACSPSAHFRGMDLHASRDLVPGDRVTIDYTLHEDEMDTPFTCKCGAEACLLEVRGWRFLTNDQKSRRHASAGAWLAGIRE